MDVRVGLWRKLSAEELMLLNCGVGDYWESLGWQEDQSTTVLNISPEYPLEGLMLKLKLQYFGIWCAQPTHWKNPDAGEDWGQEEKGATEDEMVRWHHRLYGHEFEQTPGVGDGQGSLVCCSPWGRKESDMTERLNWTEWWYSGPRTVTCSQAYANKLPTLTQQVPPMETSQVWSWDLASQIHALISH